MFNMCSDQLIFSPIGPMGISLPAIDVAMGWAGVGVDEKPIISMEVKTIGNAMISKMMEKT